MTLVRLEGGPHDGKVVDAHAVDPVVVAHSWIGRDPSRHQVVAAWQSKRHVYEVVKPGPPRRRRSP